MSTKGVKRKYKGRIIPYRKRAVPFNVMPELKRSWQTVASMNMGSIANAWVEMDMCGPIAQGTDSVQRVGRKISVSWVKFHGIFAGGAVGAGGFDDYFNSLRFVILVTKHNKTGAVQTPLATAGINGSYPMSKTYIAGLQTVIADRMIAFSNNPYGAGLAAPAMREVKIYHKFSPPLVVEYSGVAAGTHTNSTQIYISAISDSAGVPNPGMTMGHGEIGFYDA